VKAFEYVYDVINAPSFNRQFLCAAVKEEQVLLFFAVEHKEALAELTETLFFA
jgi:hypothetical protein